MTKLEVDLRATTRASG